jgi:Nif-specific regulatory protein
MFSSTEPLFVDPQTTQGAELHALYRITKLIGGAVQLESSLSQILEILSDTLKMKRATLLLYDQITRRLTIKASCGLSTAEEMRGVYSPDEGIIGQIFRTKSPFVVPDINSEPLFLNRTGARQSLDKSTISFLGVPVTVHDIPEGVLTVDRLFGEDISFEEDIRFLTILATLIGQFLILHREIEKKEANLIRENEHLKAKLHQRHGGHFIIGHSKAMQEVFSIIKKIGDSKATALLLGESGTGKELVARAIHESGKRDTKPFIKINCAALPETLLESELFGHEKGAFTGAHAARPGRFELAEGGTIFLDEIGEMPLALQAKMLRILQEKQFERIGGIKTYSADVRIIAATNVSLENEIAKGKFRADLFYRLNVVQILLPPLRERRDDIPLLFNHFLQKSNSRNEKDLKITSELLDFLIDYAWPGNVREMQNLVERMVILAEADHLSLNDLPPNMTLSPSPRQDSFHAKESETDRPRPSLPGESLEAIEQREIEAALKRNGWVQVRAARELGLTQRQIGYRIKKYGLSRYDTFRRAQ